MIRTKTPWEYNAKERTSDVLYVRAVNPSFKTNVSIPHVVWEIQLFVKEPGGNVFHQIGSYSSAFRLSTYLKMYGKGEDSLIKMFDEIDERLIAQIDWCNSYENWKPTSIQLKTKYFDWTADDLEPYSIPEGAVFNTHIR